MNNMADTGLKQLEGRSFVIGREGHIFIDSPLASKQHAELTITNGQVYLRDLQSSNGTYLLRHKKLKQIKEGYVGLLQPIVIGKSHYVVRDLLEIAKSFAVSKKAKKQFEYSSLEN